MYYIGIDLGGTNIAICLVNKTGEIILKKSIPTRPKRKSELIIKDMATNCIEILNESNISLSQIKSIGIGIPGRFQNKTILHACNIESLDNFNIENELKKYFDSPVYLENDANCAAFAEYLFGTSKGYKNSIMVTLGTGIGGGIIIDGKIYKGFQAGAGEIGHHVIISNGEKCNCGRNGCWETYASATALINQAIIAAKKNPNSKLNTELNAQKIFEIADANDKTAQDVINNYIFYLAEGLTNLINILHPEIIVIGGGISAQGKRLLTPLRKQIQKNVYMKNLDTKIVQAKLGNDAGIVGAAFLKN